MRSIVLLFLLPLFVQAQTRQFPQQEINAALQQQWHDYKNAKPLNTLNNKNAKSLSHGSLYQLFQKFGYSKIIYPKTPSFSNSRSIDTLIVGLVPKDTLVITGTWQNNGPVFIANDGVLIFKNAYATILGDIDVFGTGQLIATNSTLYLPQQYFYQRALVTVQSSKVRITDCTLNFGGLTHNFILADSSLIALQNVHFTDWTTTAMYGKPTFTIDSCNTLGEIVITDNSSISVKNTDTVLLWHHIPKGATLNWTFPGGVNLNHYSMTPTSAGVSGINYNVEADSCKLAWWALMPEDGSDITISNSSLRAIGAWFTGKDSSTVSGLADNSTYISTGNLFSDRTLQLNNTSVTTWSLYPMDSAVTTINSCIAGEIGSGGVSHTFCNGTLVDGTGGYFWVSGSAVQFAGLCAFTTNVRSEGTGIVVVGYSAVTDGVASGIDNSILFFVQSSVLQQPVANDGSDVWVAQLTPPASANINDSVDLPGSAYILRGPQSLLMSFDHYRLYYQPNGSATWTSISGNYTTSVNQASLGKWNTTGLSPGNYNLMLTLYDNFGDSVTANTSINLLPAALGVNQLAGNTEQVFVFPNPTTNELTIDNGKLAIKEIEIDNELGEIALEETLTSSGVTQEKVDVRGLAEGIYFYKITTPNSNIITGKFVKE